MRGLAAIARRETGAFFHSAMAPVVLTGFLMGVGLIFFRQLLGYSDMSLEALQSPRSGNYLNLAEGVFRPLAANMTMFLLLLMPAITMRLFAAEFRSGRHELLASWPVSDQTWVVGKWLAALATAVVLILASGLNFAVVWLIGKPEIGPIVSAMLGLFLFAAGMAALGILFSTLVNHQLVAYVMTFATAFLLFLVGTLQPFVPHLAGRILAEVSLLSHFDRFARGVLDSRDVLYFLSLTLICLFAATATLTARRLPAARWLMRWLPTLLVTCLLIIIYVIGLRYSWQVDLTGNKRYSLAPQTLQILDALPDHLVALEESLTAEGIAGTTGALEHVQVHAFFHRLDPARSTIDALLRSCAERTRAFRFQMVDLEESLELVRAFDVTVSRTLVISVGERHTSLLQPEESALINGVYRLVTGTRPLVMHLLGHGEHLMDSDERPGFSSLNLLLEDQGYRMRTIYLADVARVPASGDVLLIAGPRTDPAPAETTAIDVYLEQGGAVLALFDPNTPSGWNEWLDRWNVRLTGDVLISTDPGRKQFGVSPRTTVVTDGYTTHEITKSLEGVATIFPLAQPLDRVRPPDPAMEATILLLSSQFSWSETDPETKFFGQSRFDKGADIPGPLPFGVAMEGKVDPDVDPDADPDAEASEQPTGRLVVIGNSEFLTNANLRLGGNRDLFLNALGWLAREETLINLRGKDPLSQPVVLTLGEKNLFGWGSVLGWPILVGCLSMGIMIRHRRRAGVS